MLWQRLSRSQLTQLDRNLFNFNRSLHLLGLFFSSPSQKIPSSYKKSSSHLYCIKKQYILFSYTVLFSYTGK